MSVTDKQYADFVDRVVECREAEDRAKADTKQLYGEISDAGEDKAAIGILVRELRLTAKQQTKANFRDAAVEDGRGRYQRGKASHVRAREAIPEHDADGVIIEPQRGHTADANTGGKHETAVRSEPHVIPGRRHQSESGAHDGRAVETGELQRQPRTVTHNEPAEGSAEETSAPHSEPEATLLPQTGGVNTAPAAFAGQAAVESPATPTDYTKPNPWCLDPEECGLTSWTHFCIRCTRLKAERQSASAVQ